MVNQRRALIRLGGVGLLAGLAFQPSRASASHDTTTPVTSDNVMHVGVANDGGDPATDESSTTITTRTTLVSRTTNEAAFRVRQLGTGPAFEVLGTSVFGTSQFGSASSGARLVFPTAESPWRIIRATTTDNGGQHDNVLGFSYNCDFSQTGGNGVWGTPDNPAEPAYAMVWESRWNGNAEWNWDLSAAGAGLPRERPFGMEYKYDSKNTEMAIGTHVGGYLQSGGVLATGGASQGRLIIRTTAGQTEPGFRIQRSDGSTMMKIHPKVASIIMTASQTRDIGPAGWNGNFRMLDTTLGFDIGCNATNSTAIATRVVKMGAPEDPQFRFVTLADGLHKWGDGNAAQDTNLFRSAAGTLKTDNSFHVGADLRHLGSKVGFYNAAPANQPTITGSRDGNVALTDLLTKLTTLGLIVNNTTA